MPDPTSAREPLDAMSFDDAQAEMRQGQAMTPLRRLILLLGLLALGATVGVLGHWMSGSALWYLAIPVALAAGWLRVADPTLCLPQARQNPAIKEPHEP